MHLPRASAIFLLLGLIAAPAASAEGWVTAYYTGWRQNRLPAEKIDFDAVTHLVHFAVVPRADGTIDAASNKLTRANVESAVRAAHQAGKKILFAVGGRDSRAAFEGAMSAGNRDVFIAALIRFLRENRYDGIDVDMEDVVREDSRDYTAFINDLRERLDAISPRPLLTAAVLWEPGLFAKLAGRFDQLNIMTYDLAGPYPGWVAWHNGPLYGSVNFPNSKKSLPSADGLVKDFLAAGVAPAKLGIGLSFNGNVWSGAGMTGPGLPWSEPPQVKSLPYYALAAAYKITEYDYENPVYRWDFDAEAAYLSIPAGKGGGDGQFVSYANELTAEKMARYVRERGLGGMFVWDLAAGYRAEQPAGRRDLLLQAVKKACFLPGEP
jgi:chitinase